jgi:hypothetical protein
MLAHCIRGCTGGQRLLPASCEVRCFAWLLALGYLLLAMHMWTTADFKYQINQWFLCVQSACNSAFAGSIRALYAS